MLIVPQEKHPEQSTDFWIAKVRAIRSPTKKNRNLWLKVQWYYHPVDVAQHVPKATSVALTYSTHKNEFIFSDHCDIISFHSVERTVPVYRYVERSLAPPDIPADALWSRYDYELKTRTLMPPPPSADCEIQVCGAYNAQVEMRMCPRERCMRWWHVKCLVVIADASDDDVLIQRVLSSLSGDERDVDEGHLRKVLATPPPDISPDILATACLPIMRGAAHGLTGNVRKVVEARERIYDVTERIPSDSTAKRKGKGDLGLEVEGAVFECPRCHCQI